MKVFRILLIIMTIGIIAFTGIAAFNHGWTLIMVFIDNITSLNWSGQFNFDFMCYLIISALWIMWRHHFSLGGIILGLIASVAGIMFFAPYLLFAIFYSKGDIKTLFMGKAWVES